MKYIDEKNIGQLSIEWLQSDESFAFHCHQGLACFNQCCCNLNLFLYPYDILRLRDNLGISSDQFLECHTDMVLREGHFFPEVLLRMADNAEHTCPFVTDAGCSVYSDRPNTCRGFPVEQGAFFNAANGHSTPVYFFQPPDFCLGRNEEQMWTIDTWFENQQARTYRQMTTIWAQIRRLFQKDPWGLEGPQGAKARMALMSTYNIDRFREFVFESSFLKRYRVKSALIQKLRVDDKTLLLFGFEWVRLFVWGMPSKQIRPR